MGINKTILNTNTLKDKYSVYLDNGFKDKYKVYIEHN